MRAPARRLRTRSSTDTSISVRPSRFARIGSGAGDRVRPRSSYRIPTPTVLRETIRSTSAALRGKRSSSDRRWVRRRVFGLGHRSRILARACDRPKRASHDGAFRRSDFSLCESEKTRLHDRGAKRDRTRKRFALPRCGRCRLTRRSVLRQFRGAGGRHRPITGDHIPAARRIHAYGNATAYSRARAAGIIEYVGVRSLAALSPFASN